MSIEPHEIGARIKRARLRKGWTQPEFAYKASISLSTVQRWESGKLPRIRELLRIAELLEIPTDELVEPEEEAESLDAIQQRLAAEADRFAKLNDQLAELLAAPRSQPPTRRSRGGGS